MRLVITGLMTGSTRTDDDDDARDASVEVAVRFLLTLVKCAEYKECKI